MFTDKPVSKLSRASLLLAIGISAPARAQQTPASSGSTEVAKEGFQKFVTPPEEDKDSSALKLSLGGFVSQGNARSIAVTGAGDYFIRRGASQFSTLVAANYGRAAPGADTAYATTVENYQARVRYDYFFASRLAAFFSVSARRDRFQGLDLRLNLDPGLAYYFIDEKAHRFWAELGYDLQHDLRDGDLIDEAEGAEPELNIAESETRHNVRAFVGYGNELSETVKFSAGLEYLQNVTEAENARINFDAGLAAQLRQDLSVATTVTLKFDNNPLPGVERTDLITALSLVYTVD